MTEEVPIVSSFEARLLAGLVGLYSLFFFFDLLQDWRSGAELSHIGLEVVISSTCLIASVWLWCRASKDVILRHHLLTTEIRILTTERDHWKTEAGELLQGLGTAIEKQFSRWRLSPAECDVGLLVLKGLSNKEIAEVRGVSERTVREQCSSIYRKCRVDSRAQFAAFFLEDLLLPNSERS